MSMRNALMNGTVPLLGGLGTVALFALAGSAFVFVGETAAHAQETLVIGGGQMPRWTREPNAQQTASLPGRNVVVDLNGAGSTRSGTAPRPTLQWPEAQRAPGVAPVQRPPVGIIALRPPPSTDRPIVLRPPTRQVAAAKAPLPRKSVTAASRQPAAKPRTVVAQVQPSRQDTSGTVVISSRGTSGSVPPAPTRSLAMTGPGAAWAQEMASAPPAPPIVLTPPSSSSSLASLPPMSTSVPALPPMAASSPGAPASLPPSWTDPAPLQVAVVPPPPGRPTGASSVEVASRTLPRSVSQRMTADELTRLYNSEQFAGSPASSSANLAMAPSSGVSAPTEMASAAPSPAVRAGTFRSSDPFLVPPTPQDGRPVGGTNLASAAVPVSNPAGAPPPAGPSAIVAMAPQQPPVETPTPLRPARSGAPPSFPPALPTAPIMPIPQAPVTTTEPLIPRQSASAPPPRSSAPPVSSGPPVLDPPASLVPVMVANAPSISRTSMDGQAVASLPPAPDAPQLASVSDIPPPAPATALESPAPLSSPRIPPMALVAANTPPEPATPPPMTPAPLLASTLSERVAPEQPKRASIWAAQAAELPARAPATSITRSAPPPAPATLPPLPVPAPEEPAAPAQIASAAPPPALEPAVAPPPPVATPAPAPRIPPMMRPAPATEFAAPLAAMRDAPPPADAMPGTMVVSAPMPPSPAPTGAAPASVRPSRETATRELAALPPAAEPPVPPSVAAPLRSEPPVAAVPPPPAVPGPRAVRPELVVPPMAGPIPPTPAIPGRDGAVNLPPPLPRTADPQTMAVGRGDTVAAPGGRALNIPPSDLMASRPGSAAARVASAPPVAAPTPSMPPPAAATPLAVPQSMASAPPPADVTTSALPPPPAGATRMESVSEPPPPPASTVQPSRTINGRAAREPTQLSLPLEPERPRATAAEKPAVEKHVAEKPVAERPSAEPRSLRATQTARLSPPSEPERPVEAPSRAAPETVSRPAAAPPVPPAPELPPPAVSAPRPAPVLSNSAPSAPPPAPATSVLSSSMGSAPPPAGPSALASSAPASGATSAPSVLATSAPSSGRTQQTEPTRIVPRVSATEQDDAGAMADARPAFTIPFGGEAAEVSDNGRGRLRDLAKQMASDPAMQVQIFAYASGSDETASKARRLSLSRALSVRALLLEEGIRSTRIVVRPLGNQTAKQPADRVDVMTSGAS